jgi:hypothetical protein
MKFRTEVNIPLYDFKISHHDKIFLIGSCFVENIGQKLNRYLFDNCLNPFGIVYNPASIKTQLEIILSGKLYTEDDLYTNGEIYFSFDHHGEFSSISLQKTISKINSSIREASEYLKYSKYFFFTFGTAWIYRYKPTGQIVSNCHKVPASEFTRERLTTTEITSSFLEILSKIKKVNPSAKFIFTISPIRHWKDGAIENNLSKSILNVAIHNIINSMGNSYYFPSFEIVYDELRDYRFYERDMIHLNNVAIDFIWEKFSSAFFDQHTAEIIGKIEKIKKAIEHKPLFPESNTHKKFIESLYKKIEALKKEFPFLDTSKLI